MTILIFSLKTIRISTNDFTDQLEIKLETVITQHVTNHTNQIYNINDLNKNLLDMILKLILDYLMLKYLETPYPKAL